MNNSHKLYKAHGVVMVEFAIVLPLLVMLLFGVTEIGRALYQQNTLHKAVTVGARYMSHKENIVALDPDSHECTEVDNADPDLDFTEQATIAKNLIVCGEMNCAIDPNAIPVLPNLDVGAVHVDLLSPAKEYDDTNGLYACVIRVTATAPFAALFPNLIPFTELTPPDLNAQTEVRYIGY